MYMGCKSKHPRDVGVGADVQTWIMAGLAGILAICQFSLFCLRPCPLPQKLAKVSLVGHAGVIPPRPGALAGLLFLSRQLEAGRSLETNVSVDRQRGRVNVPYGQ